jgi:predicted RNA-binding protein YlxR (DUF448 family)
MTSQTSVMNPARSAPERTCVGCRKVAAPGAMVRVCVEQGRAVVDEAPGGRKRHGRGAWVHPTAGCLHNAAKGGLSRSFRAPVDAGPLIAWGHERGIVRISSLVTGPQKS